MSSAQEVELLKKQLALLKAEQEDKYLNPHKYFDRYEWQDDFVFQRAHIAKHGKYPNRLYLTCANQVGKSFSMMDLGHMLCTDVEFREKQWGENQPKVIWYALPSQDHINDFFDEKWEPEVLSRESAKEEGPYAWKVIKKGRDIKGIYFKNTKCKLMFITMLSKPSSMQGRSVGAILFDEEPDEKKLGELEVRTNSFNDPETGESTAILAFAFTPTTGQEYFKRVYSYQDEKFLETIPMDLKLEYFYNKELDKFVTCTEQDAKKETFPIGRNVYKRRVSIFEAQKFLSGKPGRYTEARARQVIKDQPSKKDIMIRAFASFEREDTGGKLYKYFDKDKHTKWLPQMPKDLAKIDGIRTAGLDYGSGSNHPGGVVIQWISPDFKRVRTIKMWRGEKGKVTTAEDIVDKFIEMSSGMKIDYPFYDHSCADLKTIYNRKTGKSLMPAVKDKEGYGFIDLLLKNNMLTLWGYHGEPYLDWAAQEFETLSHSIKKKDRLDELTDCIRYSLAGIAHMFDLEHTIDSSAIEVEPEDIKVEQPIDYNCRTWEQMDLKKKKKEQEDNWLTDEEEGWIDEFNF